MARNAVDPVAPGLPIRLWRFLNDPWGLLLVGLGLAGGSVLLKDSPLPTLRLALLAGSLFLCLVGIVRRLRTCSWDFPGRAESTGLLGLAGLAALTCWYSVLEGEWVSARILFAGLTLVSLVGAVLVLLPTLPRKVVVSGLILFHFGGMITAVTSIDPPNSTAPWVARQLWVRVYSPYLYALYMTNAYHFYSPDPGPPNLLWFAVHYSDGTYRWVKIPDRDNSPVGMHYQRLLALPEHSFAPVVPLTQAQLNRLAEISGQQPTRRSWEDIYYHRVLGSALPYKPPLPLVADMDASAQYREPTDTHKKLLASVARHVFWHAPKPENPEVKVERVKLYRVTQSVITPGELAQGKSPLEKTKYVPFFMGEFDGQGELVNPRDPFLYWYLPIVKVPAGYPESCPGSRPSTYSINVTTEPKNGVLIDFLEVHAAGYKRK